MRGQVVCARRAAPDAVWGPGLRRAWRRWAPFETITESDVKLAASRYKPRVGKAVPDDDPVQLISEVLRIGREVQIGPEKLLKDLGTAR